MLTLIPLIPLILGCQAEPLSKGLLLSLAVLKDGADGKPKPLPAQLGILVKDGDQWVYETIDDDDSNVFHKAMAYEPTPGRRGILTASGVKAMLKLWSADGKQEIIWEKDFGGKFSRMRDVEAADLFGDGTQALAVATHDQGVIAVVRPQADGSFTVTELERPQDAFFVHEIEIGDLNGDGVPEVYATPSLPNKLDGSPQPGSVVRYVPAKGEGPTVVANLGDRHAKEILVDDVDGDGRDELYVSVEAVAGGQVQIMRFDADTDPAAGMRIAMLSDKMCRFLTAGDIDGDGRKEMVAAAHKSGLWLLTPDEDPRAEWIKRPIDRNSGGFEHAAILSDLDGDGIDELYVANDKGAEINRYVWQDGKPVKESLYHHAEGLTGFTWNIMPVPAELIP